MGVRFVHAADLHLGSPLRALEDASPEMAEHLARATEVSFERIVTVALDEDVDFVVVAGDLYDREARSVRANQFLVQQFERLEADEMPAYVVHGNHDPLGRGAEKLDLPENVHVFGTEEVESTLYPDASDPSVELMGRSYGARHVGTSFVDDYRPDHTGIPTVGVLHTGLNPDGREYVPCGPDDLAAQAIDYWALGHLHRAQRIDGTPAAYPGIPQPRHAGEPMIGGCLLVELESGGRPTLQFVPTSTILWARRELDVESLDRDGDGSAIANLTDLEGSLLDRCRELRDRPTTAFVDLDFAVRDDDWDHDGIVTRWVLRGRGQVHEILSEDDEGTTVLAEQLRDRLAEDDPFVWVESVKDRTEPPLPDRETLVDEHAVIGEFADLVEEVRADPAFRDSLREEAGDAWQYVSDRDRADVPDERVPLTDETLDRLIDEATEIAITRLAGGR